MARRRDLAEIQYASAHVEIVCLSTTATLSVALPSLQLEAENLRGVEGGNYVAQLSQDIWTNGQQEPSLLKALETGNCGPRFFNEALEKDYAVENNERLTHGARFGLLSLRIRV